MHSVFFMRRSSAQVYSCPCVPVNVCSKAEHQPEVAPNLKQLPYWKRQSCSIGQRYGGKTEAAENWLKGVAVCFTTAAPAGTALLLCLAPACLVFFQGRGGIFLVGPVVKCVRTLLNIVPKKKKKKQEKLKPQWVKIVCPFCPPK